MKLAVMAYVILLTACAADTMQSYVGQDIRNVELAYGPPVNQIDLGSGARAFQWSKITADTTPMTAVSTTDKDKKGRKTTQTQFIGGDTTVTRCLYTLHHDLEPTDERLDCYRHSSADLGMCSRRSIVSGRDIDRRSSKCCSLRETMLSASPHPRS